MQEQARRLDRLADATLIVAHVHALADERMA
jgi:hypothetical protein